MEKRYIPRRLGRNGEKRGIAAIAVFAMCLVLLVMVSGAVIGRYQSQLGSEKAIKAKDFYFTSNFLDGGTHTLAPGSTEVKFMLGNHADDLRFSEVDIDYVVTVDNGATVKKDTGTLKSGSVKDEEIVISNLRAGTYTITATGTGGYSKTLRATIVVPEKATRVYQHQDNIAGEYTLLTIWNETDETKKVTVMYTGIPDNTNPNMADWTTNDSREVTIEAHASKTFRFFGGTVEVPDAVDKEPY